MADLDSKQAAQTVKIAGSDATGVETNFVDATANGLKVDGSAVTQPVSDAGGSLTVDDGGSSLTVDGTVTANAGTGTFAVSAASLPLPSGAATETTLSSINSNQTNAAQVAQAWAQYNSIAPTLTSGNLSVLQVDVNGRLNTLSRSFKRESYCASAVNFSAANNPTDIFTITGSATKTVKVTKITVTASQTTSSQRDVLLIKRSTANTGGTSTTQTAVPNDSTNTAATAVVRAYTANPTTGTTVGTLKSRKLFIGTTTANSDELLWEFGTGELQPIILRGVNEVLAVNMNGVTSAGDLYNINVEWTEE